MAFPNTVRTPQKIGKFLAEMRRSGNISESARIIGVPRRSLYEWREADAAFATAWDEAKDDYLDTMEKEADRRAVEGMVVPRFYKGELIPHEVREYSDVLLMFRLKGERPGKYREVQEQHHTFNSPLKIEVTKYGDSENSP